MTDINGFTIGGFISMNHGIIMTESPPEVFPERDVEVISIPGRSGDIVKDNGRYKNVPIPYKCAYLPEDDQTMRHDAIYVIGALQPTTEYRRLENTYDPDHFRMARVSSNITLKSLVEQIGTFQVLFDCKPQRFLKLGEQAVDFTAPGVLRNPTLFRAKPIITIYGTGAGTVTVGDQTVIVKSIEDQITLDCDLQHAYRQVGEGAPENMNTNISAPDFPQLPAGENTVSWTGDIERVEIIPRWWTV